VSVFVVSVCGECVWVVCEDLRRESVSVLCCVVLCCVVLC